jgi:dTDP-4-dehydrorhamnose reductase
MTTKILLLGCNGQVGWELQRALAPLGELTALDFDDFAGRGDLAPGVPARADFSQPDSLPALLQALRPEIVVNAAAHTAVDKAEGEPALARTINATAPGVLAREAARLGAWLVHYSTDYVFDGSGVTARAEDAPTGPLSVYGHTKLEGEEAIRASGCRHLILRTSWVYAARGGNFAKTMLKLAAEREMLKVIEDQVGAPTGAELLADVTAHALRRLLADPPLAGTYHCVAAGETSWHGYACFVLEQARAAGRALKVAPEAVQAISTSAFPTPARRPLNSRLDTTKLQRSFGLHLPPWQQGVQRMLAEVLAPTV